MPRVLIARQCDLGDLAVGAVRLVEVQGLEIALCRLPEGYYATTNVCPHQGGPLSEGHIEGGKIVCPWHQWRFDIKSGAASHYPKIKIKTYPVMQEGDDLFLEGPSEESVNEPGLG